MEGKRDTGKKNGTYRMVISGLVQGVGFRPFVYRQAKTMGLNGWVENRNDGVVLQVNGTRDEILQFKDRIVSEAPAASSIESVEILPEPYQRFRSFQIRQSKDYSSRVTEISPDIAVCDECISDLKNQPHRIDYPLINCTHCGPRFSILRDLPYDRSHTTMEPFEMCPVCKAEYVDVENRRFHAQPVACNSCGPRYRLETSGQTLFDIQEILTETGRLISSGALLAIKGTGGFHLVCDAFSEEGVAKLRGMKKRDGKPFALMVRSLTDARKYVEISPEEETLLTSWRRPIVLLERKAEMTPGVADGLSTLGIMLPYMPFHYLLFERLNTSALVMTSGNFSEEPILISDDQTKKQFSDYVDGWVTYNREIFNRVDDSVTAVIGKTPVVLRRARGYSPSPIRTHLDLEGILGTGAELTGAFCMGKGNMAIMSQYVGDLKTWKPLNSMRKSLTVFPDCSDLNPG